jgi:hypothetical protein
LLTFDFATIAGVFCIVDLSFFSSLLCTTLTLLGLAGASFAASKLLQRWSQLAKEVAIYLLLFAFPIVSVKLVQAFACHKVDGVFYLRADYSVSS